jgi:hypothetical protein
MEVIGQLNAMATLFLGKGPPFPTEQGAGWTPELVWNSGEEKISCLQQASSATFSVIQPAAYPLCWTGRNRLFHFLTTDVEKQLQLDFLKD